MPKFLIFALLFASLCACDEDKQPTCSDGLLNQNETETDCGGPCAACKTPAEGQWLSYPVSPLLHAFADSIALKFGADDTYQMTFWQNGTSTLYSGTCIRTPSGVNDIYTLQLDQQLPIAAKHSGIFQIFDNGTRMMYETVQTVPAFGATPPSATDGFGSSKFNGAILGASNVQSYTFKGE